MINHKHDFVEGVSYLKQLRKKLKLTREQFAYKVGTTSSTIYRWESGKANVSFSTGQWKKFHHEVLTPLNMTVDDLPDDLGAPYVKSANSSSTVASSPEKSNQLLGEK